MVVQINVTPHALPLRYLNITLPALSELQAIFCITQYFIYRSSHLISLFNICIQYFTLFPQSKSLLTMLPCFIKLVKYWLFLASKLTSVSRCQTALRLLAQVLNYSCFPFILQFHPLICDHSFKYMKQTGAYLWFHMRL